MFRTVPPILKGQTIRADWLTKLGRMVTAQDAALGFRSVGTQAFKANSQAPGETFSMMLMLEDALDESTADGALLSSMRKRGNATKLVWNREASEYRSTGVNASVVSIFGVPIPKNTVLLCRHDPSVGRWVPTRERETEMVRVLSSTPDSDGFYDAVVVRWNSDTREWEERDPAWVINANPGDAAGGGASTAGLADGNYGDVTVSGGGTVIRINPGVITPTMLDPAFGDTGSY